MERAQYSMDIIQPAEWRAHSGVWSAWPSHEPLWQEDLAPARDEVAALFRAIVDIDPHTRQPRGERLHILVHGEEARQSAELALAGTGAFLYEGPFGDICLRDTGPVFVSDGRGIRAACFQFNGWGGKYVLPHDTNVAEAVSVRSDLVTLHHAWVLEGGSVDSDGEGRLLTTEQCLLDPNRNPGLSRAQIERNLRDHLGATQVIWLGDGLLNDHTDGHIDNLARFVAPGVVAVPEAAGADDPNAGVYADALARLKAQRGLEIVTIPAVGRVEDEEGHVKPASYMNFYIANTRVIVPTYGTAQDDKALKAIEACFPNRTVVGQMARHLLSGGGSFHCITQNVPAWPLAGGPA